ncbi:MAG TPA: hypothetical protein PK265_00125 [Candidatus Saccharibacteria bacterium]|nr:hypothetical protein [Candidatus Saccharibacteria bacterium]HRQ97719.1 hypothetical protein [Candidatus Saccharibacteria bacterium]
MSPEINTQSNPAEVPVTQPSTVELSPEGAEQTPENQMGSNPSSNVHEGVKSNPFLMNETEQQEAVRKREDEGGNWNVDTSPIPTVTAETAPRIGDPNSVGAQALEAASRELLEAKNPTESNK